MGPCKTSNVFIFTVINASNLKFCPRSYSSCVYLMMRYRGSNKNICKVMMSHFRTLFLMRLYHQFVFRYKKIEYQSEYQFPKEQTWCYSQNRRADVTKIKVTRLRKSGYAIFPPKDGKIFC